MQLYRVLFGLLALLCAFSAASDEGSVKKDLATFLKRDGAVTAVRKLPVGGLYEAVLSDGQIVYTNEKVEYLMIGELVSRKPPRNYTDETRERLSKIDFSALPLNQAMKRVNGDGSRVIALFEDPNCVYCKKFESEIDALPNTTVYLFPIAVINEDSKAKVKRLWCADDRLSAWKAWMNEGKLPAEKQCEDVLDSNQKLAGKVHISGTPTLFLSNGTRITGYVSRDKIEAAIAAAAADKAKPAQ